MFAFGSATRNVAAAVRDLKSPRAEIRASAARDLRGAADELRPTAVAALIATLGDEDARVRSCAAEALAWLPSETALEALLVRAEQDPSDDVRQMALLAIGALGAARAAPRLELLTGAPVAAVRFQALIAYARCASRERALGALIAATHDRDPLVRHISIRLAEELGDPVLPVAAPMLARCSELLGEEDPTVRAAAAIVLARAGDPVASAALLEVVRGTIATSQAEDVAGAIELCGELGVREAIEPLRRRAASRRLGLGGDPFAWQARVALARLGDDRSERWILSELRSWSRDRRTLAVAAAGRARLAAAKPLLDAMAGDPRRADPDAVAEALLALGGG